MHGSWNYRMSQNSLHNGCLAAMSCQMLLIHQMSQRLLRRRSWCSYWRRLHLAVGCCASHETPAILDLSTPTAASVSQAPCRAKSATSIYDSINNINCSRHIMYSTPVSTVVQWQNIELTERLQVRLSPSPLQATLSKLLTYCVLRPTQSPTLSRTGSEQSLTQCELQRVISLFGSVFCSAFQ